MSLACWVEGGGGVRRGGVAEQRGDPGVGGGRGSVGGEQRRLPGVGGEGVRVVGGGEAVRQGGEQRRLARVGEQVVVSLRMVLPLPLR